MARPHRPRRTLQIALAPVAALMACTCGPKTTDETAESDDIVQAFEPGPTVETVDALPDPLWARELGRLPETAQTVVVINPEKLRVALRSGILRERLLGVLTDLGGPLVLELAAGLLEEVDASRPIAVALFAVPDEDRYADARFGAVTEPDLVPSFIHNRVLVPSRDPARLLAALEPLWPRLGLTPEADPEGLAPDAVLLTRKKSDGSTELSVVLIPEALGLRAEILWGSFSQPQRRQAALRRVAGPPREHSRTETPALRQLLVQRPLIGALYEPERVASFSLALALVEANQAVSTMGSELHPVGWARGVAIGLVGFDILDPRDRILADSAISIELETELHVYSTSSITPLGTAVVGRALPSAGHVFDPKVEDPALVLQSGESMRASVSASEPLRWGRQLEPSVLRERWSWAGGPAVEGVLGSARWPTLATLGQVLDPEQLDLVGLLPDAYTVVVPREQADPTRLAVALALDYRPGLDTDPARTAIQKLPWPDGAEPTVEQRDLAGRQLILVGVGVDPSDVIDLENPRRTGPVERVTVALPSTAGAGFLPAEWSSWFEAVGPAWAAWVDVASNARHVQANHGATQLGHASIALEGAARGDALKLRAFSPRAAAATDVFEDSRGWHCLRDIPHVAVDLLNDLSGRYSSSRSRLAARLGYESPDWNVLAGLVDGEDQESQLLWKHSVGALDDTLAGVEALLACAEADPRTEPLARRVRASWLATLADWADGIPEPQRASAWAEQACNLGSGRGCRRLDAIKQRTTVAIPVRRWLSYSLLGHPPLEIVLSTREMHLDGKRVADLPSALTERLAHGHVFGTEIAVYADASVAYARLHRVSTDLLAAGLAPRLVLRDPGGRPMTLPLADESTVRRRQGDDAEIQDVDMRRPKVDRGQATALTWFRLDEVDAATTWGELSERLLLFGALSATASEAERARNEAVGSAAAVPELILGPPR